VIVKYGAFAPRRVPSRQRSYIRKTWIALTRQLAAGRAPL
jgi:hypothetical protein